MPAQAAFLIAAILLVFAASPGSADRVDECVLSHMKAEHIPGLSLAVIRDGKTVKVKGYGLANVELGVRATPETVYQIQSITKQFTATVVMMLVEEGRIGLDDPVGKYLEGTPDSWKDVTIRRLLSHTSGIKDFINEPTASLRLDVSEEEVLKATAPRPLNFPPGEKYAYSNTNYLLLAMVLRKVTGKSWGELVQERICEPLGMKDTRVISLDEIIPHRASGYRWTDGRLINGAYVAGSILAYAGGGLRSTVRDMAKWDAALYTEKLLKQSTLAQMWTPARLNNGSETGYGFGWGVVKINGHRLVAHTGGHITGFTTEIQRYLDDKLTVIVLTNLSGPSNPGRIAQEVAGCYVPALARPVYKAIEDREPAVTALAKTVLEELREDRLAGERLTPEMRSFLFPDRAKQAETFLKSFGPPKTFTLVERKEEAGNRVYAYRVTFESETVIFSLSINAAGKINALSIEPG